MVCRVDGLVRVVEYSEISHELAERRDPTDGEKLFLRAGSIANHFFTMPFLERVCSEDVQLPYHAARKKVAYYDPARCEHVKPTEPNAIKLEQFIFDVFRYSEYGDFALLY